MKTFDLEKELEFRGFKISEKSREMVATKDLCTIYYNVDCVIEEGVPVGMKVYDISGKSIFEGRMPQSTEDLDVIMSL